MVRFGNMTKRIPPHLFEEIEEMVERDELDYEMLALPEDQDRILYEDIENLYRDESISFRVTAEDKGLIQEAADQVMMSVSEYSRDRLRAVAYAELFY